MGTGRSAVTSRDKLEQRRAAYPPFLATGVRTPCGAPSVRDLFTDCGDRGETRAERVRKAQAVCATCSLREPCADWAVKTGQAGVWGGTEAIARAVRVRRARGGKVNQYA